MGPYTDVRSYSRVSIIRKHFSRHTIRAKEVQRSTGGAEKHWWYQSVTYDYLLWALYAFSLTQFSSLQARVLSITGTHVWVQELDLEMKATPLY